MVSAYSRRCILVGVSFCLLLAGGCGKKSAVDGTYHDSSGLMIISLDGDSGELSYVGMTKEYTCEVVGNQITLRRSDGRAEFVFIRNADGSLTDPKSNNVLRK
jgi:hypothetical protein